MDPLQAPASTNRGLSGFTLLDHGTRRSYPCDVRDSNWISGQSFKAQEFVISSQVIDQSMVFGSSNLTSPSTHPQGQTEYTGCLTRNKIHYQAQCGLSQVIRPRKLTIRTGTTRHNAPAYQPALTIVHQSRHLPQSSWADENCCQTQGPRHPIKLSVYGSSTLKIICFPALADKAHHLTPSTVVTTNLLLSPNQGTVLKAVKGNVEPSEHISRVTEVEASSKPCLSANGRENTQALETQDRDTRSRASCNFLQSRTSEKLTSDLDQSALSNCEPVFVPDNLLEQSAKRSSSSMRDATANYDDEALGEGELVWPDSDDNGFREEDDEYWTWDKERQQWFHFDAERGSNVWCPRSFD